MSGVPKKLQIGDEDMKQNEVALRQKLGRYGYKLKSKDNNFFVKSKYTDKVMSPLDEKKQPICMTLDEIENWLKEEINEEERKKQLWKETLDKYRGSIKYPQYDEWCKTIILNSVKKIRIDKTKEDYLNTKIFNSKSDLYDEFIEYNAKNILSGICEMCDSDMNVLILSDFDEEYHTKYVGMNEDLLKNESNKEDILSDLDEGAYGLYEESCEKFDIEDLKQLILGLIEK